MKCFLTTLIILIITGFAFSQTTAQLDTKYGFKHFVFNTPPSRYYGEITKSSSFDPNSKITAYEYTGGKINDLFTVPVTKATLTYYESKLASISIQFGDIDKEFKQDEYERILYSLEKMYGKGNSISLSDQDFVLYGGRKWVGRKVTMEILRLYYEPAKSISGYIHISENSLHEKRIRDEF